jgi:hypothetical protein
LIHAGSPGDTRPRPRPADPSTLRVLWQRATGAGARRRGRGARSSSRNRPSKKADDGSVRRLGAEVGVPQAGITFTGERAGDPGVLVREVPERDAHAVLSGKTGANGAEVVGSLLLVARIRGREGGEADIDFGVGDLDAQSSEARAVDLDTAGLERFDDILCCGGFGTCVLDVVVVVVQLDVGSVLSSSLIRNGYVLSSNLPIISIFASLILGIRNLTVL